MTFEYNGIVERGTGMVRGCRMETELILSLKDSHFCAADSYTGLKREGCLV